MVNSNNSNSERVWAYLDRDMTEASRLAFEMELKENTALAKALEEQSKLHSSLSHLQLEKAPDGLAEMIMDQIKPNALTTTATSFNNIRYLGAGFIILNFILAIVFLIGTPKGLMIAEPLDQYTAITNQLAKITTMFNSNNWSTILPTLMAGILLLIFYSLDELSQLARLRKAKI